MHTSEEQKLKQQMKREQVRFQKNLGQNFLIDPTVPENIVRAGNIDENTCVLEIGPGAGALTVQLAPVAKKVVAVEIDAEMIPLLKENIKNFTNVEVICGDILKLDLAEIMKTYFCGETVKVVANLPYYITTPIIMKLLEDNPGFSDFIVMVQKEVAQRLCAVPGDKMCGAVTYSVFYRCIPEILFVVPPKCFLPQPKVDSAVIRLAPRNQPVVEVKNEKFFFEIIKYAFLLRRKTLINSLSQKKELSDNKEILREILSELNISPTVRGEALSIEEFALIANRLWEILRK